MTFSERMYLMIILKVPKTQGFIPSLVNAVLEKTAVGGGGGRGGGQTDPPPPPPPPQTDPPAPSLLRVNVHSASLLNRSQLNIIYFYQYQHYLFV